MHSRLNFAKIVGHEFVLYTLCGVAAVAADFCLYVILLKLGFSYTVAYFVGYFCGTLLSFFLNRSITFKKHDAVLRRVVLFFSVAGVGYFISYAFLYLLIEIAHLDAILSKILSLIVVLGTQYSLNRFITFAALDAAQSSTSRREPS